MECAEPAIPLKCFSNLENSRGQVGLVKSKFELYKTHLTPDFFYSKGNIAAVLGERSFREEIKAREEEFRVSGELSQVLSQRPDNTEIVNAVSRVFKINAEEIVKKGRGRAEVMLARQMAIYCSQQLGDQSLRELARNFNFSHEGSASSAIAATKRRLENGELAKEYGSVERLLNILK